MDKVVVVDYGMGNLRSVVNALHHINRDQDKAEVVVSNKAIDIDKADRVIFPGQGAAADCMQAIQQNSLVTALKKAASEKPFFGICMGMQVLLDKSEENNGICCLGLYDGVVKNFSSHLSSQQKRELKVPHMGWNTIQQKMDHPVWRQVPDNSYFYFVHSYYVSANADGYVAGITNYGFDFASVLANDKVFAMQCHPEKSAQAGLKVLQNFLSWSGN